MSNVMVIRRLGLLETEQSRLRRLDLERAPPQGLPACASSRDLRDWLAGLDVECLRKELRALSESDFRMVVEAFVSENPHTRHTIGRSHFMQRKGETACRPC